MALWLLLLLLLFPEDVTFNLSGIMTTWASESELAVSTNNSELKGSKVCLTSTAVCNNGRNNLSVVSLQIPLATMKISFESLKQTTPTSPLKLPGTSSSAGSDEQTTSRYEILEKTLETAIIELSDSTLKNRGEPSRRIASSDMATSAKTTEQSLRAPALVRVTSRPTVNGWKSSESTDFQTSTMTTVPTALNTLGNGFISSGAMKTAISEKSATGVFPRLNKSTNETVSLPMKASALTHAVLETYPTPGTAALGTPMSGVQEGETTVPTTAIIVSTVSEISHSPATHTSFDPVESTLSPDVHLTASSSSETMTSSTMTGASKVSPENIQNSSSEVGTCAQDEFSATGGICMCIQHYYAHVELSRALVTLHCKPQTIEVLLRTCFLMTHHWILRNDAFSGCSSISKIEEGHRVQGFMIDKKEGSCGLQLSTNDSHALYSLEVELFQILPDFVHTDSRMLKVSCVYPLVVNVSQIQPFPVVSFPYSIIHIPGTGDTIVILGIFTDPQQSSPLENRPVPLGTPLYVVLRATSSDPDRFALVVNDVFASTNISRMGAIKATYHFVKESCPVSSQLHGGLQANGDSLEVTLAFNLIRFLASDTLYLHGRVTLCDKQAGRLCQPICSHKSSPAKNVPWEIRGSKALESDSRWIVFGPIRISESNASSVWSSTGVWKTISLLMLVCWMLG